MTGLGFTLLNFSLFIQLGPETKAVFLLDQNPSEIPEARLILCIEQIKGKGDWAE